MGTCSISESSSSSSPSSSSSSLSLHHPYRHSASSHPPVELHRASPPCATAAPGSPIVCARADHERREARRRGECQHRTQGGALGHTAALPGNALRG
eukprot:8953595-Pyramimonas_sp.AAC.1